jgi:catechol 2,3-dioxygenase-like lactoylglutathione lyase family enzyme
MDYHCYPTAERAPRQTFRGLAEIPVLQERIVVARPGWLAGLMEQSVSVITLGVADVEAARAFYVDGLGWEPTLVVPDDVVFLQVGHGVLLALWNAEHMSAEAGPVMDTRGSSASAPITLGHNVADAPTVDAVLRDAEAAGSPLVRAGEQREWGGYSGYFTDLDGYRWEVVHNPGLRVEANGRVVFGD